MEGPSIAALRIAKSDSYPQFLSANKRRRRDREGNAMQRVWLLIVILAILSPISRIALAQESGQELSSRAQKECDLGRQAKDRAIRLAHFKRSQALAEEAVALDDQLADGHFALFCSLGEQLRIDGESLSSAFGFRRMMTELDRTLELNPDHLDALSSKGTFLVRLPAVLGGDAVKGEHMLRRVIQRDPMSVNARLTLAKTYAARGNHEEAITLAREAMRIAEAERRADLIPEAQATLSELWITHAGPTAANP
jgi:tetratricopeptide (TPR) repeat protein